MPKYKKKITSLMDYSTFKDAIKDLPILKQAFLSILFFAGCRVSEALALSSDDISCQRETIFIQFFRLKGSKQTDPQEIPNHGFWGLWICQQEGELFSFSRTTAYRIVKSVFPVLYPHYFRSNRFTKSLMKFDAATVVNVYGVTLNTINRYIAKVDIKKVGKALHAEIQVNK